MSSEPNIRVGFVGCGAIAEKHRQALEQIPTASLTAVADVDLKAANRLAKGSQARSYSGAEQMLNQEKLDLILILTPSGSHFHDVDVIAGRVPHALVEKPLALTITDAKAMIEMCERKGTALYLAKQNRFNKPVLKLKQAVEQGRFGKLVSGSIRVRWTRNQSYYDAVQWRGTWEMDGGALCNQAGHHLDMLLWLMGDVDKVSAMISTRLLDIEVEDTGVAALRFRNGALGSIEVTTATRPSNLEGSISVLGAKGSAEIGGFYMNELKTWQFDEPQPDDERIFEKWGKNPDVPNWNRQQLLTHVIARMSGSHGSVPMANEGLKSIELIHAIYQSAEVGEMVQLGHDCPDSRLGKPQMEKPQ